MFSQNLCDKRAERAQAASVIKRGRKAVEVISSLAVRQTKTKDVQYHSPLKLGKTVKFSLGHSQTFVSS